MDSVEGTLTTIFVIGSIASAGCFIADYLVKKKKKEKELQAKEREIDIELAKQRELLLYENCHHCGLRKKKEELYCQRCFRDSEGNTIKENYNKYNYPNLYKQQQQYQNN